MKLLILWKPGIVGAAVWVPISQSVYQISILLIMKMCYIRPRLCPNLTSYSIYPLRRAFPVKGTSNMSLFSYVKSVQNFASTFLNFPVGDNSFTRSII